jgi:hypothetical protein
MATYVTLINRTNRNLTGTWNGREYKIVPGKNSFPEAMAVKFKDQNPIFGTQDPFSNDKQYLLGIEEANDPIDSVEQSDKIELLDRSKFAGAAAEAVPVRTNAGGLYAHERQSSLPLDGTFVKA